MTIELHNVELLRDGKSLLDDITLSVREGEVLAVTGANGAGKTSLVRILSGELEPDGGDALLDGASLHGIPREERARRIAVLPQHASLDFPFVVSEVVGMGRIPHFTGSVVDREIVADVISRMELRPLSERVYTTLSGGERQRVHIARVLCQLWDCIEGSFLLLDEPTAPLDLAHQLSVLELVREIAARGAGVAIVIHDINLAARFCDRMALLRAGRLVAQGTPAEVVTKEHIGTAFSVDVEVTQTPDGAPLLFTKSALAREAQVGDD